MNFTPWYIIIGLLLIGMALAAGFLKRLPLSTSMLYLGAGIALGPMAGGMIRVDPLRSARLLERVGEIAVIISLFTAGLKLSAALTEPRWRLPIRLAFISMTITVGMITLAGVYLLKLPLGAAVLLGAIIAPTDPVLASDVQVEHPRDRDRLRFALTGEAGLNDGTSFPFVMLGLGLLGLHPLGGGAWRWWTIDVLWAIGGGLGIGAVLGWGVGKLIVALRQRHRETIGLDDYLSLGLLASAYGIAVFARTYGFLAAFAAGLALRRIEVGRGASVEPPPAESNEDIDPADVPAYMGRAVLGFNQQLERIAEVALVLIIGGLLAPAYLPRQAVWFIPLVLVVIRPIAVFIGLAGSRFGWLERGLIGWFGVRGVGSLYYLMFAIAHGLAEEHARLLTGLTLTLIAASIVIHGVSVTPLMMLYERSASPSPGKAGAVTSSA